MKTIVASFLAMLLLAACNQASDPGSQRDIAALRAQVEALRAEQNELGKAASHKTELGQQMLLLQIRHGRLWAAGENENWLLAHFQLAELNEALDDVVEQNGDDAALQPEQLSVVLPAIMQPAVTRLREAIDHEDRKAFEAAYDGLSDACTACHQAADHGFLVIQRPQTPVLDNLKAKAIPAG
jgi:hypothetical protein